MNLSRHFFSFSCLKNLHKAFAPVAAVAKGRTGLPATVAGEGWM